VSASSWSCSQSKILCSLPSSFCDRLILLSHFSAVVAAADCIRHADESRKDAARKNVATAKLCKFFKRIRYVRFVSKVTTAKPYFHALLVLWRKHQRQQVCWCCFNQKICMVLLIGCPIIVSSLLGEGCGHRGEVLARLRGVWAIQNLHSTLPGWNGKNSTALEKTCAAAPLAAPGNCERMGAGRDCGRSTNRQSKSAGSAPESTRSKAL
jgi:hypothetical protein